jgi:hypothetical protein
VNVTEKLVHRTAGTPAFSRAIDGLDHLERPTDRPCAYANRHGFRRAVWCVLFRIATGHVVVTNMTLLICPHQW